MEDKRMPSSVKEMLAEANVAVRRPSLAEVPRDVALNVA
jgi:hypothetical protein